MTVKESQTNQQINSIVPYKDHYRYYLYLFMKNFTDLLTAMASGGTATLNLNTGNFSKIKVPLPGENILKECHKVIELLFDKIFNNQKLIRTLEQMRDTLLPKLMSGEVRVEV
jgi:type I restriction enzyme S subunit